MNRPAQLFKGNQSLTWCAPTAAESAYVSTTWTVPPSGEMYHSYDSVPGWSPRARDHLLHQLSERLTLAVLDRQLVHPRNVFCHRISPSVAGLRGAGDGDQAGLLEKGEVVFEVPVLDDSGAGVDVLDVNGVEVDGLAVARNAVVGAGEMPLEHQAGGECFPGDVRIGQLAGEVGYRGAKRRRGGAGPGRTLGTPGGQGGVLEGGGGGFIEKRGVAGGPERVEDLRGLHYGARLREVGTGGQVHRRGHHEARVVVDDVGDGVCGARRGSQRCGARHARSTPAGSEC